MAYEMKAKTKRLIMLLVLSFLYVAMQILTIVLENKQFTIFNGVITSLQYGICLVMLGVDRKSGIKISLALMGVSFFMVARAFLMFKAIGIAPGVLNTMFYMITIGLIAKENHKKEIESITDLLTGTYNRRGLYLKLKDKVDNKTPFSVIYFCLDNFKVLNDNYGHAYGDEILRKVCRRMNKKLDNNSILARIGGAEFVVVLDGDKNIQDTANVLLGAIKEKATVVVGESNIDCYLSCYAGMSSYPQDASDYESVIKNADIAMYDAIAARSNTVYVFDDKMAELIKRQMYVEKQIKDGLKNNYFYLVYQPQFYANEKKLRGFETLLRMKTPDGQMISPGEFIPVAEKGDMILEIDDYVLRRAMVEFKDIVEQNNKITVSVNVSAKNIGNIGFVEKVKELLNETGFSAKNLEIEITEYCMVDSMQITKDNITSLRELGIQIALDDFGTGYTSLNYVAELPINLLKVDKSLVDDIVIDSKRREFVNIVISMGHLMGCEVISEGVEDDVQLKYLTNDGCDLIQGYVWSRPLEYDNAKKLALE